MPLSITRPGKIVCVGLNYHDHAEEGGQDLPKAPLLFAKWPNTLIGDGEPIVLGVDGPVTGGYPKPAMVVRADLGRVARLAPGDEVRFRFVRPEDARAAWSEVAAALEELER